MANVSIYYTPTIELKVSYENEKLSIVAIKREGAAFWPVALVDVDLKPSGITPSMSVSVLYKPFDVLVSTERINDDQIRKDPKNEPQKD